MFENNFRDISIEIIRYLRDKGYHMLSSDKECDIIVIHQSSKFCPPYSKAYEF